MNFDPDFSFFKPVVISHFRSVPDLLFIFVERYEEEFTTLVNNDS